MSTTPRPARTACPRRIPRVLWWGLAWLWLAARSLALDRELVLAAYQGPCRDGDFDANLATVREITQQAQKAQADFLVFPEAYLSGYETRAKVEQGARPINDPALQRFIQESAAHEMVIMVGLTRRAADGIYNSELVIHRGRLLGFTDKVMLTGGDRKDLLFLPGKSSPVYSAHGVVFGVIICHDSSFPHLAMAAKLQGAEILFSPHYNEIGEQNADEHRRWVRNCHVGLAAQMKLFVARANIVRTDHPGRVGYGDSFILAPNGEPLVEARLFKTELITARIGPALQRSPYTWADLTETPAWVQSRLGELLQEYRRPVDDADLDYWLDNMVRHHQFSADEVSRTTGLTRAEATAAIDQRQLRGSRPGPRAPGDALRVFPYPGGRHPRIGFLDGAVMPQRETKVSVFTPWDDASYVVVDVPEAIFSNLGLTYLAHTHIPTIWDTQGVKLPRLEWNRPGDGTLDATRALPNGIAFGAKVMPGAGEVRMELWLRNGTTSPLKSLRVQNCVMLRGAPEFAAQTVTNKVFSSPFAAVRSATGDRWVITAWERCQRAWGNEHCPCLHSDPEFPECAPGQTVRVRGWVSFYEGGDLPGEFQRLAKLTGW